MLTVRKSVVERVGSNGWLSWLTLVGGVGAVVLASWAHLTHPRGHWEDRGMGAMIGSPEMKSQSGDEALLSHPTILQVSSERCRYCRPARVRFWRSAERFCGEVQHILVVWGPNPPIKSITTTECGGSYAIPGVAPGLTFIEQVPFTLATNAEGRVVAGYVGIPSDEVMHALRRASRARSERGSSEPLDSQGVFP